MESRASLWLLRSSIFAAVLEVVGLAVFMLLQSSCRTLPASEGFVRPDGSVPPWPSCETNVAPWVYTNPPALMLPLFKGGSNVVE